MSNNLQARHHVAGTARIVVVQCPGRAHETLVVREERAGGAQPPTAGGGSLILDPVGVGAALPQAHSGGALDRAGAVHGSLRDAVVLAAKDVQHGVQGDVVLDVLVAIAVRDGEGVPLANLAQDRPKLRVQIVEEALDAAADRPAPDGGGGPGEGRLVAVEPLTQPAGAPPVGPVSLPLREVDVVTDLLRRVGGGRGAQTGAGVALRGSQAGLQGGQLVRLVGRECAAGDLGLGVAAALVVADSTVPDAAAHGDGLRGGEGVGAVLGDAAVIRAAVERDGVGPGRHTGGPLGRCHDVEELRRVEVLRDVYRVHDEAQAVGVAGVGGHFLVDAFHVEVVVCSIYFSNNLISYADISTNRTRSNSGLNLRKCFQRRRIASCPVKRKKCSQRIAHKTTS